jgi:hypothetical protein
MLRGELPGEEAIEYHLLSIDRDQFSRSRRPWNGHIVCTTPRQGLPRTTEPPLSVSCAEVLRHSRISSEQSGRGQIYLGPPGRLSEIWRSDTALSGTEATLAEEWSDRLHKGVAHVISAALRTLGRHWRSQALESGQVPRQVRPVPGDTHLHVCLQVWRGLGSLDPQHQTPGCGAAIWTAGISPNSPLLASEYRLWQEAARQHPGSPAAQDLAVLERLGYAQALWL